MKSTAAQLSRQLKKLIPRDCLNDLANDCKRSRIFDPLTTLHCYISQILTSSSAREAVAQLNLSRIKSGKKSISLSSSAFVRARAKLSEQKILNILIETGKKIQKCSNNWKWKNRDVYFADGTIITMADTEANRKIFPKSKYKGVEVGFPKIRLLGLFSASTGAFIDGEWASYSGKGKSESSLLLKLLDRITPRSILILDRFFTSLSLQSILQNYNIDYVIRGREAFVKKLLGSSKDKTVVINKSLPDENSIYLGIECENEIKIRLIQSSIKRKGFRSKKIYIVTSLFEEDCSEVEKLYIERWNVELDIRNLKTTMESTHLQTKTPEGGRKELWVRLLGYNLIRNLTLLSSLRSQTGPRKRSFKLAMNLYPYLIKMKGKNLIMALSSLGEIALKSKYRREPRALKGRKTSYPLLTTSRKASKKQDWGYKRRRPSHGPSIAYGKLNNAS